MAKFNAGGDMWGGMFIAMTNPPEIISDAELLRLREKYPEGTPFRDRIEAEIKKRGLDDPQVDDGGMNE